MGGVESKSLYRSLIVSIGFIATAVRFDTSYAVSSSSRISSSSSSSSNSSSSRFDISYAVSVCVESAACTVRYLKTSWEAAECRLSSEVQIRRALCHSRRQSGRYARLYYFHVRMNPEQQLCCRAQQCFLLSNSEAARKALCQPQTSLT